MLFAGTPIIKPANDNGQKKEVDKKWQDLLDFEADIMKDLGVAYGMSQNYKESAKFMNKILKRWRS